MTSEKIAVVGNRKGWTYDEVEKHLDKILKIGRANNSQIVIVSGGAEGVDSFAHQYAKNRGLEFHIFFPRHSVDSPQRFYQRNIRVAKFCDRLIGFNLKSFGGTKLTMKIARDYGKEVIEVKK